MVTKSEAAAFGSINWDAVRIATEVPRTYLVRDQSGHEFFKMYKPSEAERIFKATGWTGHIVSTLSR